MSKRFRAQTVVLGLAWFTIASPLGCASVDESTRQAGPTLEAPQAPVGAAPGTPVQQQLVEVRRFIRVDEAWKEFDVKGRGLSVVVIDTGLFTTHVDFSSEGKVPAQLNLTNDNGGNREDATDRHGHGTNVGGIIVANGVNVGVAPDASIVPIKVLSDRLDGSFLEVREALEWVIANAKQYDISIVGMSLGAKDPPFTGDAGFTHDALAQLIRELRSLRIPVVVAAGNNYRRHRSKPGMSYPAILRETISVGAVYDADGGALPPYRDGSKASGRKAGQITPFTHRLHESVHPDCRTDIFAPGAPVTSTGHSHPRSQSTQQGTSQAAPVTAGVVLLMQELYRKKFPGQLPSVDDLERWLRLGGVAEFDGDNENDNVTHTRKTYIRLDALQALRTMAGELNIPAATPVAPFGSKHQR